MSGGPIPLDPSIQTSGKTDDELNETFPGVSHEHVHGFYDHARTGIHRLLEHKGHAVERVADYLLLVPDIFMLMWRLMGDASVSGKNKVLVGSAVAYFILPFDVIPEAIVGPIGYLDDLIFGVYVLNKILTDTDLEILRQHWSGDEDVLESMRRVLNAADQLVASDVIGKLKKLMK